ncbi:hypothetical protein ADUPG1_010542 [Aduncisulcus paluster]|uniref:Uncharacterized protein n=1 Tax=Aduncisulcus paluster TaxID=2918883 RepID=A0ABQ5JRT3_9EUKA|nr:hypothetical protein ADUPG1_010542 [Aduncisulcus paluster]|eukprot:gnl/Carplike_NY0171/1247_a1681_1322.p1 GENE.gnl/Carplike_NY0171/1247_a1681_1322~~gnl/Carplike_NY0171/1247_a1681_1322.p1  ORF type:complete len:303 (+),score=92.55 gnl/Carplike_NY0171/1247_a1681_1322:81-989(+)
MYSSTIENPDIESNYFEEEKEAPESPDVKTAELLQSISEMTVATAEKEGLYIGKFVKKGAEPGFETVGETDPPFPLDDSKVSKMRSANPFAAEIPPDLISCDDFLAGKAGAWFKELDVEFTDPRPIQQVYLCSYGDSKQPKVMSFQFWLEGEETPEERRCYIPEMKQGHHEWYSLTVDVGCVERCRIFLEGTWGGWGYCRLCGIQFIVDEEREEEIRRKEMERKKKDEEEERIRQEKRDALLYQIEPFLAEMEQRTIARMRCVAEDEHAFFRRELKRHQKLIDEQAFEIKLLKAQLMSSNYE